jgi:hypothetical protein
MKGSNILVLAIGIIGLIILWKMIKTAFYIGLAVLIGYLVYTNFLSPSKKS